MNGRFPVFRLQLPVTQLPVHQLLKLFRLKSQASFVADHTPSLEIQLSAFEKNVAQR